MNTVAVLTMMSTFSCRFLQVAEKVSEVPNVPYQILLRMRLLNFSGCFSRITWNLCAIDASCKTRNRELYTAVFPYVLYATL